MNKLIKDMLSIFNMEIGDKDLAEKERNFRNQTKEVMALKIKVTNLEQELVYANKKMAGLTAKNDIAHEALNESNRTIEALELAMEMREHEVSNIELHKYIAELELEQERTLELIEEYSQEMNKV